ncbi:hypothetical protein IQ279_23855 [Streptomyces verrucosisporus]|uniref:hypothetical protein n=1 Tax=Streptomyces verrucosisporus TaxID=1695161 RepID=UPI0019D2EF25|nr:hypothetical protein [Streptomyces verrucosisporus]MBN3932613.1 hypothetical protein [Streptomyces verrucosisporus]
MTGKAGSRVRRGIVGAAATAAALAALATAGWYGYVWLAEPMSVLSSTGEVDAASREAAPEGERRLEEIVDGLPGVSRQLGTAAKDHCLRHPAFEGEPPGPVSCQWRLERYVVLDGDPYEVGEKWAEALGEDRWTGSPEPLPVNFSPSSERYGYRDTRTRDHLVVTLVRDGSDLPLLYAPPVLEPFTEHERKRRDFTGREAAREAVAEGRRVARISLLHAYHAQEGDAPFEPLR